MKKYIPIVIALMAVLAACTQQETVLVKGNGRPAVIRGVRLPHPDKADSLITEAEKLQTILIMGENLQAVNRVCFDDIEASVNPTYISENYIFVSVPFSETRTQTLTLYTSDNLRTDYPFVTYIPSPRLNNLKCEYVPDGEELVINGSFFYEPVTVRFPGETDSLEATITSLTGNQITCIVPEGAQPGYLTVTSKYGVSHSDFQFRDQTGLITTFENIAYGNPWAIGKSGSENPCDGNYLLLKKEQVPGWFWSQEDLAGCYWDYYDAMISPFMQGDVTEYALRFEANVIHWEDVPMHIWFDGSKARFGLDPVKDGEGNIVENFAQLHWAPWLKGGSPAAGWDTQPYTTDGWQTFTFPLTEFKYDKEGQFGVDGRSDLVLPDFATIEKINIMVFGDLCAGPDKHDIHICMDNLRIVPLESKNPLNVK